MARTAPETPEYPTCVQCLHMGLDMPYPLAALEAAIGHPALVAFLLEWGGLEVGIPSRPVNPGTPHAAALDWLRREVGYGRWMVPRGPVSDRATAAWETLRRLRAGQSLTEIARAQTCHTRTISNRKTKFTRRGLLDHAAHDATKDKHP